MQMQINVLLNINSFPIQPLKKTPSIIQERNSVSENKKDNTKKLKKIQVISASSSVQKMINNEMFNASLNSLLPTGSSISHYVHHNVNTHTYVNVNPSPGIREGLTQGD